MEDGRLISKEKGEELAKELGLPYMETSAKYGININETFGDLAERIDKMFGGLPRKITKNLAYQKQNKCC